MPYTNTWNESVPLGTITPRSSVDDLFRSLKLDIRERMNVIVDDWTADPVVVKSQFNGSKTGLKYYIHYSKFYAADTDTFETDAFISDAGGGRTMFGSVELLTGYTITQVRVLVQPTGDLISQRLKRVNFDLTAAESDVYADVSSSAGTGLVILDSGVISHQVLADSIYLIRVNMTNNSRLYGAEITYNS